MIAAGPTSTCSCWRSTTLILSTTLDVQKLLAPQTNPHASTAPTRPWMQALDHERDADEPVRGADELHHLDLAAAGEHGGADRVPDQHDRRRASRASATATKHPPQEVRHGVDPRRPPAWRTRRPARRASSGTACRCRRSRWCRRSWARRGSSVGIMSGVSVFDQLGRVRVEPLELLVGRRLVDEAQLVRLDLRVVVQVAPDARRSGPGRRRPS